MTLIEMSLSASLIIITALLIRAVFKNRIPWSAYVYMWYTVLSRLLIPFKFNFSLVSIKDSYLPTVFVHNNVPLPLLSASPRVGLVVDAGFGVNNGNYIIIDHGNGYKTTYAHCKELNVNVNDRVNQGDTIATVGKTGIATGYFLAFGLISGDEYVNLMEYLIIGL